MTAVHDIWFVAWPGLQPLDLVGPHEVFATANRVADGLGRGGPRYQLRVVSMDGGEVETESGLRLGSEPFPTSVPDTLALVGGDGVYDAAADADLARRVGEIGNQADRLAIVCTGTFLAAAAGLVDGHRVATHWARARRLAQEHPRLDVDAESLYVQDGNVWSSAGVTAGIDLALALVEHDHDAEVAQITGRWLVVHLRRPGNQSQFAAPMWTDVSEVEPVRRAQDLIHSSPGANLSVDQLAASAAVSARHLTRLFVSETGETPARYVEQVRVDAARRELETTSAGLAAVALHCGFGTTETLRRAFRRRLGLSPDEYRRQFRQTPIKETTQ